ISKKDSLVEIAIRNEYSMLSDANPMFDDREVKVSSPSTQAKIEAEKVVEVAVMMGLNCDGSLEDLKEKIYQMELVDNNKVLPLYFISLFQVPVCVMEEIEKIRRSFFWGKDPVVTMTTRNNKVVWSFDSLGKFSSRSFGKETENSSYRDPILHSVWKFKALLKALLLCWQSIVGKRPTRNVLLSIGIIVDNQAGCPFYNSCIESVDHIFIHYFHVNLISITSCGSSREKNDHNQEWCPPIMGSLKFNVDGAARGKSGPASIGGLLRNNCGVVLAVFSIPIGVLDSNVAKASSSAAIAVVVPLSRD
nr:reverse transcriptase [Tanacetum cinerariifolium]